MNWLEFFFGWLVKGQYNVSMFDGIMFFIEFMIVNIILYYSRFYRKKKKEKVGE